MVSIWVIEFRVTPRIKLDGEQWGNRANGGVREKSKVLTGEGIGWGSGSREDKSKAEAGTRGIIGEYREDELGRERGRNGSRIGRGFDRNLRWVKSAAEGKLVGVVGEADHWGLKSGIVAEVEGRGGVSSEGVEEKFDGGNGGEDCKIDENEQ